MNYTDMMEDLLEKSLEMITAAERPNGIENIRQQSNSEEITRIVNERMDDVGFDRTKEKE